MSKKFLFYMKQVRKKQKVFWDLSLGVLPSWPLYYLHTSLVQGFNITITVVILP